MNFKSLYVDPRFSVTHSVTSSAIPLHGHSEYVVGYYIAGRSQCDIGEKIRLEFRQGDAGLLNPGDAHQDHETKQARDYLNINIKRDFFREIARELGCAAQVDPYFPSPKVKADRQMKRIFEALRAEVDGLEFGREILMQSLVMELAVHLLRKFMPSSPRLGMYHADQDTARWQIRRALQYLEDNFNQDFSLERTASAAGLSKYYLERVFKKATGLPPHTYALMLRVERAKELLTSSPKPIVDIAIDLGFSHQSHFTNVFRRMTGLTPLSYRRGAKYQKQQHAPGPLSTREPSSSATSGRSALRQDPARRGKSMQYFPSMGG